MEYKDYYQTLGVNRSASSAELKKAYRRLARKYHPDVSKEPQAEEKFKDLSEAYNVLKSKENRAAYDQLGTNWQAGQDFHTPRDWSQSQHKPAGKADDNHYYSAGDQVDATQFSSFFDSLFGQSSGFQSADAGTGFDPHAHETRQGQDQHASVQIDIADAFNGTTRQLSLSEPVFGANGEIENKARVLKVKIPKGIKQGQTIRLKGQGVTAAGTQSRGDLFLEIKFASHRVFKLDGKDISVELPVEPWEAVLGANISVPMPDGKSVMLNLPAGSKSGQRFRLKGKGLPTKTPGDLYVTLKIVVPESGSETTIQAYEALKNASHFDPRKDMV